MKKQSTLILHNYNLEARIVRILLTALILGVVSYIVMIGSVTLSVISRKSMESDTRSLLSEIHRLELSYLASSEAITLEYAHNSGFVDAKTQSFATTTSAVAFNGQTR